MLTAGVWLIFDPVDELALGVCVCADALKRKQEYFHPSHKAPHSIFFNVFNECGNFWTEGFERRALLRSCIPRTRPGRRPEPRLTVAA